MQHGATTPGTHADLWTIVFAETMIESGLVSVLYDTPDSYRTPGDRV